MDPLNLGFKIRNFRKLDNWKLLEINKEVLLVSNTYCPVDNAVLNTICTLVGNEGTQRLRIGCCTACGYVGYIDRPTREWVDKFYADTWDKAEARNIDTEVTKWRAKAEKEKGRRPTTIKAVEKLMGVLDKNRPVCDIGCGYGVMLKKLRDLGFTTLIGMESSLHRAKIARRAFGIHAITAPFEDLRTQSELKKWVPLGLIFSHHVLEHVYDPAEIIKTSSQLQKEGDYIIVTLPHLEGEFSLGTLLYIPHLNAFPKHALKKLLAAHDYTVVDDSLTTKTELCMIAQKVARSPAMPSLSQDPFGDALQKFSTYFGFGEKKWRVQPLLFWCFRDIDIGGHLPFFGNNILTRAVEILASRFFSLWYKKEITSHMGRSPEHRRNIFSLVVEPLTRRFTSYESSPLEIQFEGNIKLSYK